MIRLNQIHEDQEKAVVAVLEVCHKHKLIPVMDLESVLTPEGYVCHLAVRCTTRRGDEFDHGYEELLLLSMQSYAEILSP
jgi:hypothetical protein